MTSKYTHNRDTAKSSDEISGDSVALSSTSQAGPDYVSPSYEAEEISTADNDIKPKFVPGGFGLYQQKSDFAVTLDDIPVTLDVTLVVRPLDDKISYDVFWDIILKQKVPVTTSLVAVMGLPSSGKTAVLESILRQKVKVKDGAKIDHYLRRKKNEQCLSIYELCALGSSRHDKYAWSFATNRYGAIFSILCGLIRLYPIISSVEFELRDQKPESVIEEHVQWLMGNIQDLLEKIKDESGKLTLIQDGVSLINVMDVGVNKALYDFLSMMLLSCDRHIRLAFFSLNRDGPKLHEKPDLPSRRYGDRKDDILVMQPRSRLTYLLHFATVGYTNKDQLEKETENATVMIATKTRPKGSPAGNTPSLDQAKKEIIEQARLRNVDHFLKNWIVIDIDDEKSITKEFGQRMEDILKNKYDQLTIQLPLRWIFLRSLVVSLDSTETKAIILSKKYIIETADKLKMKEDEVENFLKTFTDFGSILYMPQYDDIKDIVIVNIWEFTQYLNKLYYPQEGEPYATNLLKYGIISESSVKKIFFKHPKNAEDFMTVLTTFAMASKIKSGQSILIDQKPLQPEVHYYLPLARICEVYKPSEEENDYAFIEIESVNFPANVQACISNSILKNKDAVLIATEHNNISRFQFQSESGPPVKIEMIYKGSKTRLRIMNSSNDILTSPATVEACKKVITGSCRCLQRKINVIRDLKYSFAVPCASPEGGCHFLYNDCEPQLCDACSTENNFRLCWSKAAKQCDLLSEGSGARTSENNLLNFQDISGIITGKYKFDAFKKALNIDESKFPDLSNPEDSEDSKKKAMMLMLLLWEKQTDKHTRHALIDRLKENGCDDMAEKLKNTSIAY
ncbi:PREDICTED: uncharacterized protein LOC109581924 [Amphimedon queenslandica]|uniref:Death domain-containing protein n=1 Tax=Amphimedon queenslandica TaxID=400682 RepID=A0AAN0J5G5_AMPQE|nr:PREDICTED: uncharacterized protein LOC109581924 [Amphimedon queenslandica]|eukprot:XP_019851986.1 PREDICTED: uncharacterized protein LOC109581924 [Amphimedon queenslandica]